MPTFQELPEIFALTDGVIPFRIYLYAANVFREGRYQRVTACPISLEHSATITNRRPPIGPLGWDISVGSKYDRAIFWDTGYCVISSHPIPIPIYDFMDKGFLFQNIQGNSWPLLRVSSELAAETYRILRDIRNSMYNAYDLPQQQAPLIIAPTDSTLPRHVLLALLRSAIADGKSCPISLVDFEDMREFGITPCYHLFEKASIDTWISTNKSCPECRKSCTTVMTFTV